MKINNNNYNNNELKPLKMIIMVLLTLIMSVSVSALDAGLPKGRVCVKVESFCSRNL